MKGDNELRKATLNMKSDQDVIAQINVFSIPGQWRLWAPHEG